MDSLDFNERTVAFIKILPPKYREGPHLDVSFSQVGQIRSFLLCAFPGELCQVEALLDKSVRLRCGVGSHKTAFPGDLP